MDPIALPEKSQSSDSRGSDKKSIDSRIETIRGVVRDLLSFVLWSYVVIKLFVFDIDSYILAQTSPDFLWVLDYKFFVITSFLSVLWLFLKTSAFLGLGIYVFFFPVILFFWKLPRFLYRKGSWNLTFAAISAIASSYKSVKYNFITLSFFLGSLVVTLVAEDKGLLLVAGTSLSVLMILAYWRRFVFAFKPSTMHQIFMNSFSLIRKHGSSTFALAEDLKSLELKEFSPAQLTTWTNNLQMAVVFNRMCLFTAKKLKDYEKTGVHTVSVILITLLLMFQTVIAFACINFSLFKIDASSFQILGDTSFFSFIFYSFNNLIFSSSPDLVASSTGAKTLYMIQTSMIFVLGLIFVSILISEMKQRHEKALQEAITKIEEEGKAMEGLICAEYRFNNIEDAISELERVKASMISIILRLSKNV